MLNLESRQEVLGITVFQDASRPNQFYYLPGPPHISHERGQPCSTCSPSVRACCQVPPWRGFLNMAVDVGIGPLGAYRGAAQRAVRRRRYPSICPLLQRIGPVIASARTVRPSRAMPPLPPPSGAPLVAKGPRFIENILGQGGHRWTGITGPSSPSLCPRTGQPFHGNTER